MRGPHSYAHRAGSNQQPARRTALNQSATIARRAARDQQPAVRVNHRETSNNQRTAAATAQRAQERAALVRASRCADHTSTSGQCGSIRLASPMPKQTTCFNHDFFILVLLMMRAIKCRAPQRAVSLREPELPPGCCNHLPFARGSSSSAQDFVGEKFILLHALSMARSPAPATIHDL